MKSSKVEYDVIVERDVMVKMRDGAQLATDIYRPAKNRQPVEERFPCILVRTSYDKDQVHRSIDPEYFTKRGYVVVVQDVRGRYKSEGSYYHGVTEAEDGYDTIEWIAQQPWCNGKVGMTGISYLAAVQSAAAILRPPHLASIFHVKAPSNYYFKGFREGGAFMSYMIPIVFMFAITSKEAISNPFLVAALSNTKIAEWLNRQPLKKGTSPLRMDPLSEQWLIDVMIHEDYDDYWKNVPLWVIDENWDRYADVPGYYIGGWYDTYCEDTFYTGLAKRKSKPIKLLMGPWTHLDMERFAGDVDFGPEAAMSYKEYNDLQLRWFDQTLKGLDTGILDEPPVKIFVMGGGDGRKNKAGKMNHGGKWRFEKEWPLARTIYTKYYLHADGSLDTTPPSKDEEPSKYVFDPKNPVPTIGSTFYFGETTLITLHGLERAPLRGAFHWIVAPGAYDQRENPNFFGCKTNLPLSSRHDILVFATPPLTQNVEVTGQVTVKLWASSTAPDTDFTAKLIDVHPPNEDYPDGYAMNLVDSIIRARYRKSFEKPELMKPGEIYEFTIKLPATSNLFTIGHQIRLDISSSNFPAFDVNPNTGESPNVGGRTVIAENTIYHDVKYPSHIVLPIIP